MELPNWIEYIPPPGTQYRIEYAPEGGHTTPPDLSVFKRVLDRRQGIDVRGVVHNASDNRIMADVRIYVGDMPLLSVLGTFVSDNANFWRIVKVTRTDDKVPSGVGITVGRVLDRVFDPIEDVGSAAYQAGLETVQTVRKVGVPTAAIVGAVILGFFVARR